MLLGFLCRWFHGLVCMFFINFLLDAIHSINLAGDISQQLPAKNWLFLWFLMANLLMANLVTGLLSQPMPPSRTVQWLPQSLWWAQQSPKKKTVASYLAKQVSLLRFVQNMRMETHAVLFTLRSLTDECSALELIQAASSQNNFLNFILHFDLSKNNNRDWLFLFGVCLQFLFCFLFGMCFGWHIRLIWTWHVSFEHLGIIFTECWMTLALFHHNGLVDVQLSLSLRWLKGVVTNYHPSSFEKKTMEWPERE